MNKKFYSDINFIGVVTFCVLVSVFLLIKIGEAVSEIDALSNNYVETTGMKRGNP